MADDNDMPEAHDVEDLDASARRLAALELSASRRTDAAKLPSNDDLLIAIKAPDGQKTTIEYKNSEFRKITTSLGLTAERDNDLFPVDKVVFKDGKPEILPTFKLDGKAQIYETPAGNRRREVAHKNPHTSGEQAPDIMVRMKGGVMKGLSRLPDDGYEKCTAWELEADLGGDVWLKSKLHGYQTIDFIERTFGPNQATHRLGDYVGESRGYNQDTHSAYRGVGKQPRQQVRTRRQRTYPPPMRQADPTRSKMISAKCNLPSLPK
ncbi:hypothetical protein [Bradyrhizobium cosmicum]|uniref:VirE2 family protein n=1 Tax=Bradyrhizobium cosmicum TaxID=1404864 RepID=UPI0028F0DC8F|nr:hypothetical protein [Bradyrhizobium cosmicum]